MTYKFINNNNNQPKYKNMIHLISRVGTIL